jgi:hypothetical protein
VEFPGVGELKSKSLCPEEHIAPMESWFVVRADEKLTAFMELEA